MATLAKKSFHLMNNIRSSNNTKIDSRNKCIENVRTNLQCKLAVSLNFARSTNAQAIQSVQGVACQCCHPGHNDRRYTKVSQSWLDAICGSISCARPIHGQCRKQKHANSIQSLQNCHHPGQWPSVRNGRNLQQLPVAMRGCLGDHVFFTITSMPRGASMVTRLGSEPRGNSSVQSHK